MSTGKCIIILSEKSSGSSLCQRLLGDFAGAQHITKTRHYEFETLYWTKAASVLKLPQQRMLDSEVPLPYHQAKNDLIHLLRENLENYSPPTDDHELIFGGWRMLCLAYRPIFVEKSPHHLLQWSALELMLECMRRNPDINFLFIGLVRHPMNTIYSQFRRWRSRPEDLQHQWLQAYQNLLQFKELLGEKVILLRYEDMVSSIESLQPVFDFCERNIPENIPEGYFRHSHTPKWRQDRHFAFTLSEEVIVLAQQFGYSRESMINTPSPQARFYWPLYRESKRALYKGKNLIKKLLGR
jgi:hypothetical protein